MSELLENKNFENTYMLKPESHVLVLYVGGTIGMVRNATGVYVPAAKTLVNKLRSDSRLHDSSYCIIRKNDMSVDTTLVLPEINKMRRIIYTVTEYEPLIDSSNVTSEHWRKMAEDIKENYHKYDGFVILHGTDTLSYSAAALSFMLENLGKSVVLTGSQIPMFELRSDGSDNFIGALIFSGYYTVPEVTIFFHNKLMRGNRTIKFSSSNLDPFTSPNAPPIAKVGTKIEVDYHEIRCSKSLEKFRIQTKLEENVGLLRIFPNISLALVKSFLQSGIKGIVLQTYGCGNFASSRVDLVEELKEAIQRHIIIVNCSQCYNGDVTNTYESGEILTNIGVISGFDMTSEAALCKLSYILGNTEWDFSTKKKLICTNLRGELTSKKEESSQQMGYNVIKEVGKYFGLSTIEEISELTAVVLPSLVYHAIKKEDITQLKILKSLGANFNMPIQDDRTPLHIACAVGNAKIIEYLLSTGCIIHVKDRNGQLPLIDAIENDNHEAITLLKKCGAHIPDNVHNIGENLCKAASAGLVHRLISYKLAGVDLNKRDYSMRTPLHAAVISNHVETVKFLLNDGVPASKKDCFGETALDFAIKLKRKEIINLLNIPVED